MLPTFISVGLAVCIGIAYADPRITTFANSLALVKTFDPIKAAYWTGLPHHRRTPFAISPDGTSAYLAYLDTSYSNIVIQQVDPMTFEAVGTPAQVAGYEAAGLVAQNDGFALLATVKPEGTTDLPPNDYTITTLIRYKAGTEAWRTNLNGPGVHVADGLSATPDANGDLVYSSVSGLYAAYFVVTAYSGFASGHFGDSIQYVNEAGALQNIPQASTFGCSHNTGIGIEAADIPPFATICAEDHGSIWLNTDTQTMSGVKIANENATNGASGEPMGGMSGSYSNLGLFPGTSTYIFAWQSRGAVQLTQDTWLGAGFTQSSPRWLNHNVAVSSLKSKSALRGSQASSVVGAAVGDEQVTWITNSDTEDHQNVHVAALTADLALVTWETLTSPKCEAVPLGCTGTYAGTSFQFVDASGAKVGGSTVSTSAFVSGDIAVVGDRLCWPYVDMAWDLSAPKDKGTPVTKLSFACAANSAAGAATSSSVKVEAASTTTAAATSTSLPGDPTFTTPVAQTSANSPITAAISPSSTPPVTTPEISLPTSTDTKETTTGGGRSSSSFPGIKPSGRRTRVRSRTRRLGPQATPSFPWRQWGQEGPRTLETVKSVATGTRTVLEGCAEVTGI